MIVDTSALLAIALGEPEAERMAEAITAADSRQVAAMNWLEYRIVIESRHGPAGSLRAESLLEKLGIEALPMDTEQMREALLAWRRYGKGRHAARLNMGDCCAYAAAVVAGAPLLFKGEDFSHTDIEAASW